MLEAEIVILIIGMPMLIVTISSFMRFPFEESGYDLIRALDEYESDVGLDVYLVSVTVLIGSTVARYGTAIPAGSWIAILSFGLLSAVMARLYVVPWIGRRNRCFFLGTILGAACFAVAFLELALV